MRDLKQEHICTSCCAVVQDKVPCRIQFDFRELKMYKRHFVAHLPCIIIQMRRKSPPSTFQGIQATVTESSFDGRTSPPRFSIPHSSPHVFKYDNVQNQQTNSDLFNIEIEKQSLSWQGQEKIEYCLEIPEGSIFLADALEWLDSIYSKSSQMTETQISSNCNSSEFFSSIPSNTYSDTSLQSPLSYMEEVVNTSPETKNVFENISAREHPKSIQESVKIISVQPSIAHAPHLVESLLIGQGLTSDEYPSFGQQEQHIAANCFDTGQVNDNVGKIMSLEENTNEMLRRSASIETTTSPVSVSRPFFFVDKENFYSEEISGRNFALGSFCCSICNQVTPNLGKRPVKFSHDQLSFSTNCFSRTNLLGGDETGLLYKGLLKDGQYIAVRHLKQPYLQGDDDYLAEIEQLSCVQHRNLVMLLGYCAEDSHFMLVYEYVCNKSLSWHLEKENNPDGLEWWARQKIAVGAARGLRYLHEECHGGCIVHCEIKVENIFLTHDFFPMVGNFGLAWLQQAKLDSTKGQLAGTPEYPDATREEISWKTDVYAFGVVLLELITGRRALDNSFEPEKQNLVDWARPLLFEGKYHEVLDSRLESSHDSFELVCMVRAATVCITKDPSSRPQMSQVLRILEGGNGYTDDSPCVELPLSDDSSLLQCDQKNDTNPKSHPVQVVINNSSKPKRKSKGVTLTYDEMLQ